MKYVAMGKPWSSSTWQRRTFRWWASLYAKLNDEPDLASKIVELVDDPERS
jgi:hypothetical protein